MNVISAVRKSERGSSPTVKEGSTAVLDLEPSLTVELLHRSNDQRQRAEFSNTSNNSREGVVSSQH